MAVRISCSLHRPTCSGHRRPFGVDERDPSDRRRSLRAATEAVAHALKAEFGATRVRLFGSLVRPWFHEESEIDVAAGAIAEERRADAWDRALEIAQTDVDLVFVEEAPALLRERIVSDGEGLL